MIMIDFSSFFEDLDNDNESIILVLSAFLDEYGNYQEKINYLYKNERWGNLFMIIHSLKGMLLSLGESDLVYLLDSIENAYKSNKPIQKSDIADICLKFTKVELQIKCELDRISNRS